MALGSISHIVGAGVGWGNLLVMLPVSVLYF